MGEIRQDRLRRIYEAHADRVMAYCLRHLPPSAAEDAVGDVFLVAWRRIDHVPDDAIGWLLVTAKNTIRNRYRSDARAMATAEKLAQLGRLASDAADVTAGRRADLVAALGALGDDEREALLLTAWDGLNGADAARVLGCSPGALRVRVHRARQKMADALGDPSPDFNREGTPE